MGNTLGKSGKQAESEREKQGNKRGMEGKSEGEGRSEAGEGKKTERSTGSRVGEKRLKYLWYPVCRSVRASCFLIRFHCELYRMCFSYTNPAEFRAVEAASERL